MLLPMYGIWTAMKYSFTAYNYALAWVVELVNGFDSAIFLDITTNVARVSFSSCQDSPGASCCYSSGIIDVSHCIMAISCICTLLGAVFINKIDNLKKINKQVKVFFII